MTLPKCRSRSSPTPSRAGGTGKLGVPGNLFMRNSGTLAQQSTLIHSHPLASEGLKGSGGPRLWIDVALKNLRSSYDSFGTGLLLIETLIEVPGGATSRCYCIEKGHRSSTHGYLRPHSISEFTREKSSGTPCGDLEAMKCLKYTPSRRQQRC